jgi:16S rRNA (guanine527-N7)-methyltransferase
MAPTRPDASGRPLLETGIEALGLHLPDAAVDRLVAYLDELERWSGSYNLVSYDSRRDLVVRHLLDSLAVRAWTGDGAVLDVGSGAGLPGVPLAIADPARPVTVLDANGKKVRFLRHVRRVLMLDNLAPVQARVEQYAPPEPFACVVSRAFADLARFATLAAHLLAPGGRLVAMKGKRPEGEISGLPRGLRVEAVEPVHVPYLHAERHVVIMAPTPNRAAGDAA